MTNALRKKDKWILAGLMGLSVVVRLILAPNTTLSPDYETFYKAWALAYREMGFVEGMSHVIGDYYVPFNLMYALVGALPFEPWVLTALIPSVFDFLNGYLVYRIVRLVTEEAGRPSVRLAAYAGVCSTLLPFVPFNSALWKQVDSIYVFFALWAVLLLVQDRALFAFVLLGVSFSLKQQAVFCIPFFGLMYFLKRRTPAHFSLLQFGWLPFLYLVTGLPAVLCKRGLRATYFTYFRQLMEGSAAIEDYGMVSNYPNLYQLGDLDDRLDVLSTPAVLFTFLLLLGILLLTLRFRKTVTRTQLFAICAYMVWTCTLFLPSMHERYDYLAVLLFSALAFGGFSTALLPAVVLNVGQFLTYLIACHFAIPILPLTFVYVAVYLLTGYSLWRGLLSGAGTATA